MRFLFVRVYGSRSRYEFIRTRRKPDYLRYGRISVNFRNCRINTFLSKSKKKAELNESLESRFFELFTWRLR